MADDLVREGIPSTGVQLYDGPSQLLTISNDLLRNRTEFPFILFLPQHHTERVLSSRLSDVGVKIQWQRRVVSMAPCDDGVQVVFEDGSSITTQYVIGADGCRSTIRTLLGLSYNDPHTGEPYDGAADQDHNPRILTFADIALYEPLPPSWSKEQLSLHTGGGRFVLSVPLPFSAYPRSSVPGEGDISFWRIAIMWKRGDPLPPKRVTIEYVEWQISLIQDNLVVTIAALLNGSRYRVRNAIAEAMYKPLGQGHVLLAGDSAHSFSPTGGQGMNLGFRDALALIEAISVHMKSQDDQVLMNYSNSRRDRALYMINLATNTLKGYRWLMTTYPFMRRIFAFIMTHVKFLQTKLILKVSGLV